ncbi:hypothetical protein [Ferruginibacter sp. SUN106]|uniref:hypothetical protein n=1 Tax=Ferruginibacter sp. SUN106 TaxID=2978348 RepID=UPI003D3652F6
MQQLKKILVSVTFIFVCNVCLCQEFKPFTPLTADSLATGNYKDVLSSFFQLAFNNLIGSNKELKFTSNPFAVMAKMNPALMVDTNYYKYRNLRKLNFSFAGRLDTSYRFNGFTSSVNYAIINKRDITVSRAFLISAYNSNGEFNRLNDSFNQYIATIADADSRKNVRKIYTSVFTDSSTVNFDDLDTAAQHLIIKLAKQSNATHFLNLIQLNPSTNIRAASQQSFDSLKKLFQNKLLWTVGIADTTYQDQFMFSNIVISSQLLKGVIDPGRASNVELNIKTNVNFADDTATTGRGLKRSIFTFEPGLNWVLKSKFNQQSLVEFQFSGSYNHILKGMYTNEKKDNLTFNGTIRVRIMNDIWIPLEFKYDPRNGNVLGFINVKANFNALSKTMKSL